MFLPPVLIPACSSSSLAFFMMISAYRLNKQGDSKQPCHTLLDPISCSIQDTNCCFLTHIQISYETGKMIWYSHLSKSFPQLVIIHTVKGFSIINETEIDVLLKFPCLLNNPMNVGNLISSSFFFSKLSLDIWKHLFHIMLKPSMQDFKHDLN